MEMIMGLEVIREIGRGAEASVFLVHFFGKKAVLKVRLPKVYRARELDALIRAKRTVLEARLLGKARSSGVCVPALLGYSRNASSILMEYVDGMSLSATDDATLVNSSRAAGASVGMLHLAGIVHGDTTPSNFIIAEDRTCFIDFGLGDFASTTEARAVDVNLFLKAVMALRPANYTRIDEEFREGYASAFGQVESQKVFERVAELRLRGRYVSQRRKDSVSDE